MKESEELTRLTPAPLSGSKPGAANRGGRGRVALVWHSNRAATKMVHLTRYTVRRINDLGPRMHCHANSA
jgi:hypothetical protein